MGKLNFDEKFLDFRPQGKIGRGWECGDAICGEAECGNEEHEVPEGEGLAGRRWGVYQKMEANGDVIFVKKHFYIPKDPKTAGQLTQRNKFRDGMIAWGNLTTEQKEVYNKRGSKLGLPGQNVFLKEYLNSH